MRMIYLALAWAAGIVAVQMTETTLPLGIIGVGLAVIFGWVWPYDTYRYMRFALALVTLFVLGGFRLQLAQPDNSPNHIARLNNQGTVTLYGVVNEEPDERDTYTRLRVDVEEVIWLGVRQAREGQVLVYFPPTTTVAYGDRIVAQGTLRALPRLDTFDYREKLARQGIFSQMRPLNASVIGHEQGVWYKEQLISLKRDAQQHIENGLPEPQASLLSGILLGDDKGLSQGVKEAFNDTGTSHVIAISGFNMTIIAGMVSALLGNMFPPKRQWIPILLSIVVIGIYTVFVGANAAVVRAAVMSSVLIAAPLIGRKTFVPASLAFTAFLMSILDPWVLWDVGFQLSFAAVLGMALFTEPLDHAFRRWLSGIIGQPVGETVGGWLSEPLIVSLVAQAFTLPLVLYYFGRLSIVSPAVNLLIVPVQSMILFMGGTATIASFVWSPVGEVIYGGAWLFLLWTTTIVRHFANLSIAAVAFTIPQWALITAASLTLILTILHAKRPPWYERLWAGRRTLVAIISVLLPFMAFVVLGNMAQRIVKQPDGRLHVVYLDMGLSNSALIESPDGTVFLINGGRYPSRLLNALGDHLSPTQRQIEVLWITGDTEDDIGGLSDVIERYEVKAVITGVSDSTEPIYQTLITDIERRGIPLLSAETGWHIDTADGVEWRVLSPLWYEETAISPVLRLRYDEAVFLFTNTLPKHDEDQLLKNPHLVQATVLQAADHASDKSNSEEWLSTVQPQVVIVQNDPSHWEPGAIGHVMARFTGDDMRLYRTDHQGEIHIATDGQQLFIQTEHE